MSKTTIIVSVCMITYNHEDFISEAIEGVLMQKTDFPIELIIGEDCSTDNTRKIVVEYANKYPNIIRLLLPDNNLGMMKNFVETLDAANGKYIALCEGDDYWTDPYKLQKQVDFLEMNEGYAACFHNASLVDANCCLIDVFHKKQIQEKHDFLSIVQGWFVPTASLVFRSKKSIYQTMNTILSNYEIISGDRLLLALIGNEGFIHYFEETMCAYRKHAGGISSWGNVEKIFKSNIVLFILLKKHFTPKYKKVLTNQIFRWYGFLAIEQYEKNKYVSYFFSLLKTVTYIRTKNDLKGFVKLYFLQKLK